MSETSLVKVKDSIATYLLQVVFSFYIFLTVAVTLTHMSAEFFTTKDKTKGTGLGLSLVFSIIEDLNGDIDIISPADKAKGTGTQVILHFPCYHSDSDMTDEEDGHNTDIQQTV